MDKVFLTLEEELRKRYYGWEGGKQFEGTSARLSRLLDEFFWTSEHVSEELEKCKATFVDSYDEMVVEGPTSVWTLCPHHLLPCHFTVFTGYVPNRQVLGLSKLSRIAEILSRRPTIQEQYTRELASVIWERTSPKGVGVYVIGEHGCMRARGIRQDGCRVTTAELRGVIKDRPEARTEFYTHINGGCNR